MNVRMQNKTLSRGIERIERLLAIQNVRQFWMYVLRIIERMDEDHIFLSASGIAFSVLLCFIPIALLVFYVLGLYLDSDTAAKTINYYIDQVRIFPFQREQIRVEIFKTVNEVIGTKSIAGIIGGIGLLWSASALFSSVRTVLNRVFRIATRKNVFASKLKDFIMLSLIGVIFIIATIFSYLLSLTDSLSHQYLGIGLDAQGMMYLASILSMVVTFLTFCMLFIFIPDHRLPFTAVIISSLIGTGMWELAKMMYSQYINNFWSIGRVYGPYSIIVVTALWIYYSSVTLIIAAEFGEMYIERNYMRSFFASERVVALRNIAHSIQRETVRGSRDDIKHEAKPLSSSSE